MGFFRQKLTSVYYTADPIPPRSTKRKYRAPSDVATSPTDSTFATDHLPLSSSSPIPLPQVKRSRYSTEETSSDNNPSGSPRYHFRQRTIFAQQSSLPVKTVCLAGMPKYGFPLLPFQSFWDLVLIRV
jgi:hypothetical protein